MQVLGYARSSLTQPAKLAFPSQTSGILCISRVYRVRLGAPFLWRMQNLEKMFFPVTVPRRGMPPNPTPALPHRGREPFRCSSDLRFLREPPLPDCFRYWCAKAHPIELYPNSSAVGWGLPHRCTTSFAATDVVHQGAPYGSYLSRDAGCAHSISARSASSSAMARWCAGRARWRFM